MLPETVTASPTAPAVSPEARVGLRPRRAWVIEWTPEILFLSFTTVAGILAAGRWVDPQGDPGFSWSIGHRLAFGETLYRDVYLPYGPYSPYLLAGVIRLIGDSVATVLLWNWIPAILAGVLLLRLGKPHLTMLERVACALLVIGFSIFAPGPGRLVFPYYTGVSHALALSLAAILLVRPERPGEAGRAWISGALAGLAFGAKQEVGVAALAALLAARIVRPRETFRLGIRSVGGFVLGAAPAAIVALTSAAVESLTNRNHLWPFDVTPPPELNRIYRLVAGMSPGDWPADLRGAAWGLLVNVALIALAALLIARERRRARWAPALLLACGLFVWWLAEGFSEPFRAPVALSVIVAFAVALFALAKRDLPDRARVAAVGVFAGFAGMRTVFSPRIAGHFEGPAHLAVSLTWVLFLCVVAPVTLRMGAKAGVAFRRIAAILVLALASYGAIAGAQTLGYPWKRRVSTGKGDVFLPPREAAFFDQLRKELRAGETALVVPEINAVDVVFGVKSVAPLLDVMPGWLDASLEAELIARLEKSPPSVVIVFHRPMPEFGFGGFGLGYGEALETWIQRNYRPVFSDRAGVVYRKRP